MTERIKEALEKAREKRQQGGDRSNGDVQRNLPRDLILARAPFREFSEADKQRLIDTASVVTLASGEHTEFEEERHEFVHYLLSGVVVLSDSEKNEATISAEQLSANNPLPMAHGSTVTATTEAELLRVPRVALPVDAVIDVDDVKGIPRADYTATLSGQQLAELVDQINAENDRLETARPKVLDPMELLSGETLTGTSEATSDVFADLHSVYDESTAIENDSPYSPRVDDDIGAFTRDLEARFSRYVERVRAEERARYEKKLQSHARRLQQLAQKQLKAKLATVRERYQNEFVEREKRLRNHYRDLRVYANKLARQKAAIYAARNEINQKLRRVEQINSELSSLGSQLNEQLGELDHIIPSANSEPRSNDGK